MIAYVTDRKNDATARIRFNGLLEKAEARFFPEEDKPANVPLEPSVATRPKLCAY